MENLIIYLLLMLPFVFLILFKTGRVHNSPPSPLALPLIGHLHLIKNSLHLSLATLSSRYGPIFSLRLGSISVVVVSSPSAVEECFTKNDIVFANRPKSMAGDRLTYNYTAFVWSSYGHIWRTLRRLCFVELFSSRSLQISAQLREEEIRSLLRLLGRVCTTNDGQQRVDLSYLASIFSFNNLMRVVAGKKCVGEDDVWTESGKEKVRQIRETFLTSQALGIADCFPVLRWTVYKGQDKYLMSLHKKRDEFLQHLIDEIRAKSGGLKEGKHCILIETMLSLQQSEPEFYNDDVIKSVLLVMFVAGTETSALTLQWAMSLLLTHTDELDKLKQEIDEKVGHDRLLNESDLVNLPHLGCIVNETLRLHPPVPLLLPHCSSQDCTVGGYSIAKGTMLVVNAWAMHWDPNLWNEPEKFKPERFERVDLEKDGHRFVAFGMGRRGCPGSGMAIRTVSLALGAFVQCFHWEKISEDEEVVVQMTKPLEALCISRDLSRDLISQF